MIIKIKLVFVLQYAISEQSEEVGKNSVGHETIKESYIQYLIPI